MWRQGGFLVQGTPDIVVPRPRDYFCGEVLFILVLPDPTELKQIEFVATALAGAFESEGWGQCQSVGSQTGRG